jgi:hypothetical protein
VSGIRHIGKEADRLEEQFFLGLADDAQIDYGAEGSALAGIRRELGLLGESFGQRELASRLGCSRQVVANLLAGRPVRLGEARQRAFAPLVAQLMVERESQEAAHEEARSEIEALIQDVGLQAAAVRLRADASNLLKMGRGKRAVPAAISRRLSECSGKT